MLMIVLTIIMTMVSWLSTHKSVHVRDIFTILHSSHSFVSFRLVVFNSHACIPSIRRIALPLIHSSTQFTHSPFNPPRSTHPRERSTQPFLLSGLNTISHPLMTTHPLIHLWPPTHSFIHDHPPTHSFIHDHPPTHSFIYSPNCPTTRLLFIKLIYSLVLFHPSTSLPNLWLFN